MTTYYHDTSSIVKHYRAEAGTAVVNQLMREPNSLHIISRLSPVEFKSALAKHVRMGEITETEAQELDRRFRFDIANRQFQILRLLVRHLDSAKDLIDQYGATQNLRTLDAIQLATALEAHSNYSFDYLVCADTNLCQIAQAEGLAVINPLTYTP